MAIKFISCDDNLTKKSIQLTLGVDFKNDLDLIPVGDEDLQSLGFSGHTLAPWSFVLCGEDGLLYYLTNENEWEPYSNDGSGGGGKDSRMLITVTNEGGEYSCDKTFEEIYNAGEANSVVIYDGYIYRQVVYTEEVVRYELTDASSNIAMKIAHIDIIQDDSVEYNEYEIKSHKSEGVVIVVNENQTVNGYQVPKMTADDVTRAYNAVVAAKPCTITDANENQHFAVNQADDVSDDICVNVLYYDKMLLTYTLSNDTVTTEYTEIGGGKLIVNCTGSSSSPSIDKTYEEIVANASNCELHMGSSLGTVTIFNLTYIYENGTDSSYVDFVYIDCDTSSGRLYIEKVTVYKSGQVEYTRAQNEP